MGGPNAQGADLQEHLLNYERLSTTVEVEWANIDILNM